MTRRKYEQSSQNINNFPKIPKIEDNQEIEYDFTVDLEFLNLKMRFKNQRRTFLGFFLVQISASMFFDLLSSYGPKIIALRQQKIQKCDMHINHQIKMIRKSLRSRKKPLFSDVFSLNIANKQYSHNFSNFLWTKNEKNGGDTLRHSSQSRQIFREFIFNNSQIAKSEKCFQLDIENDY